MISKYSETPVLHIVHCIDTEGPMTETIEATFDRIKSAFAIDLVPSAGLLARLQNREIDLDGMEGPVARMIAPELLDYNTSYDRIGLMLKECLSENFRKSVTDDFGGGWVYSWHCMDHLDYHDNPRRKDVGYGNVFRYYRAMLKESESSREDEINWHFHPQALTGHALHAATSYTNSAQMLNEILCRRILEDRWFPVVNRPGFHAERPDSHSFLEQWIPFDFANQYHEDEVDQPDLSGGRFGDWRRATPSWIGYHPDHDDYQIAGNCRRMIFRCLNVGTRFRSLKIGHIHEAFMDARNNGVAILAFADHDYRDIRPDVASVRNMLAIVRIGYPEVRIRFSGAEAAARDIIGGESEPAIKFRLLMNGNRLNVEIIDGQLFGPQPFLAMKGRDGRVYHDNLDLQMPGKLWSYVFDEQTLSLDSLAVIGVGGAGRAGGFDVGILNIGNQR